MGGKLNFSRATRLAYLPPCASGAFLGKRGPAPSERHHVQHHRAARRKRDRNAASRRRVLSL